MLLRDGSYLYSAPAFEYYNRARALIRISQKRRYYLLYAALECRFLIESLLKEFLAALSGIERTRNTGLPYKPASLIKAIKRKEPRFADHVRFVNALLKGDGVSYQLPVPDLHVFRMHYESLNEFLHTHTLPPRVVDSEWWRSLEVRLLLILEYFEPYLVMPKVRLVSLNAKGLALLRQFCEGAISSEQVSVLLKASSYSAADVKYQFMQYPQE